MSIDGKIAAHCLINLVKSGNLKLSCIQSMWEAGQEW